MAFDEYAGYYDLLYRDKDYKGEADYIMSLIKKYCGELDSASTILELGCGTGKHASYYADNGYNVFGIDMSEGMLHDAEKRAYARNDNRLQFMHSDIRSFDLDRTFDISISFFHVISYQNKDEDVSRVLQNVKKSIKTGGYFIFDTWYGPAVLYQRPELRVKRLEDDKVKVTRIAESVLREYDNVCEVHYDMFVENKEMGTIKEITELHPMRYFFDSDIERLAGKSGFELVDSFEFMTGKKLSKDTWGSCFVLKSI